MAFRLAAISLRQILRLLLLSDALPGPKDLELLVLRHELDVLNRQIPRPRFEPEERWVLSVLQRLRPVRERLSTLVMPDTIRRWHRKLVRSKWHYRHRVVSREWIPDHVRLLVWRLASENPTWGYCRLRGELKKVRAEMSTTSIRRILAEMHRPPPRRETWRQFIRAQASSIIAVHLPHGVIDQPLTLVFAAGRGVLEILNLQLTRRGVVQGASAGRGPSRSVQCAT